MTDSKTKPSKLKRVVIEPLTRVEGHGKVVLYQDEQQHITQARLHIAEFRGFEKFIQGRPFQELPVLVQRLCGICPVSHHLAAAKACDGLVGSYLLTPTAEKIRRLMHYGQVLQSHALHFFHLSSPDLLFGFDDAVCHRNLIGLIQDHPQIAKQGVFLRKFGQQVIEFTAGKRIHGTGAIPGGVNQSLSIKQRDQLLAEVDQMIDWGQEAVALIKQIHLDKPDYHNQFARIDSNMLSLTSTEGNFELYDGVLRAINPRGETLFDQVNCNDYNDYLNEEIRSWSYMKCPFMVSEGIEHGWYRVGPLARLNNCNRIGTPRAEQERIQFVDLNPGRPVQSTLAYHWARMIELLYCAESIKVLLMDEDITGDDLINPSDGRLHHRAVGVIEAPRGTLIHDYEIDQDGLVTQANLMVSTTHNNQAMNESIRQVANTYLDGQQLTEPMLNQIEVAIRAYDPCLSCATHALGKMPLEIQLFDANGALIDQMRKGATGIVGRDHTG